MSAPSLPPLLFEDCPVKVVRVGSREVRLCATPDMDALLDHYAATQPDSTDAIPYYAVLWDSALALAEYLAEHFPDLSGRSVVELGCGLGLPSIFAAVCGADVLATDFHPDCEAFLRRNAALNQAELEFAPLDWAKVPADASAFDVVLASDVVYEAASLPKLVEAASRLCRDGGVILFADPGRTGLQDTVNAFATAGYTGDWVPVRSIFVFELRRCNTGGCHGPDS